jgi:tRNA dimethylallyltransferase
MTVAKHRKPNVVVICGPTGIGKTTVAIELAGSLGGEIVSADSMQIYRFMDIGTAKPTPEEQAAAPHHMIDIVDPDEPFDAARYATLARQAIASIIARQRLPLVVGGTGFYIRALLGGLFDAGASNPKIRRKLLGQAEQEGTEALYERLGTCDPETAAGLHPNDTFRIVRALEVFEITGRPLSVHQQRHGFGDRPYDALIIGLDTDRRHLYERIDQRVDAMMAAGFLEEVKGLLSRGYGQDLKSMQSIGYRHMLDLIGGRCDRQTTLAAMKRDTRRYAKRQLTWFRADPGVVWIAVESRAAIRQRIDEFLSS